MLYKNLTRVVPENTSALIHTSTVVQLEWNPKVTVDHQY